MAFPSLESALNKVSNRYLLVVLSAKRARQLTEQEHRLVGGDRARDAENQLAPVEPHPLRPFASRPLP